MAIDRAHYNTLVDDSGAGTDGSAWDKADVGAMLDAIDALGTGDWTAVTFAAGNFTGSGSMAWTVAAGDVTTLKWTKHGKRMCVQWVIGQTTVGGGAVDTALRIVIPGGFTAAAYMTGTHIYTDNSASAWVTGPCRVQASGTFLELFKADFGATTWTISTDLTSSLGFIEFETTT